MERPAIYRLWQAPFAEAKLEPVRRLNDFSAIRNVLDVGCGPGTSTRHFARSRYLGLDLNPAYLVDARRRYGRNFVAIDVREFVAKAGSRFDFILVNSLFHHLDWEGSRRVLSHLATLLTEDGHIHILDLVMPDHGMLSRTLARLDRGEFPRPLDQWRQLFSEFFEPVVFEPYPLKLLHATLWNMVYFKAKPRT